jgi:hypothetical protein
MHPLIYLRVVPYISSLAAPAVCWLCCERLSLTAWIVQCEGLSLTTGLYKFLKYFATLVLDLVCPEQICFLTIFVNGLTEDENHI